MITVSPEKLPFYERFANGGRAGGAGGASGGGNGKSEKSEKKQSEKHRQNSAGDPAPYEYTISLRFVLDSPGNAEWMSVFHFGVDPIRQPALWINRSSGTLHPRIGTRSNQNDGIDQTHCRPQCGREYHVAMVVTGDSAAYGRPGRLDFYVDGSIDTSKHWTEPLTYDVRTGIVLATDPYTTTLRNDVIS